MTELGLQVTAEHGGASVPAPNESPLASAPIKLASRKLLFSSAADVAKLIEVKDAVRNGRNGRNGLVSTKHVWVVPSMPGANFIMTHPYGALGGVGMGGGGRWWWCGVCDVCVCVRGAGSGVWCNFVMTHRLGPCMFNTSSPYAVPPSHATVCPPTGCPPRGARADRMLIGAERCLQPRCYSMLFDGG